MTENPKTRSVPNVPREIAGMARHHYRNVNGKLVPIQVRNLATNEVVLTTFVDAREMVAGGGWEWVQPDTPEAA